MNFKDTQCPEFGKWIFHNITSGTVLDIGCGNKWYYPFISANSITSVDAWADLKPDIVCQVGKNSLPFDDNSFDTVLMFDVIEHLSKLQGEDAISEAKRVCRNILYLLTPVIWQDNALAAAKLKNPFQHHLSLWAHSDFEGQKKWKFIRGVFKRTEYYFGKWEK